MARVKYASPSVTKFGVAVCQRVNVGTYCPVAHVPTSFFVSQLQGCWKAMYYKEVECMHTFDVVSPV